MMKRWLRNSGTYRPFCCNTGNISIVHGGEGDGGGGGGGGGGGRVFQINRQKEGSCHNFFFQLYGQRFDSELQ